MRRFKKLTARMHGTVLIISMIFLMVFSSLAVSMASLSSSSIQIPRSQHKANGARASAESGFEITRFWLNRISVPGNTNPAQLISTIATSLQNEFSVNSLSNITSSTDGNTVTMPSVTLNSAEGKSFYANIIQLDDETIRVEVTGVYGSFRWTISVNYALVPGSESIFDYGVASNGSVHLTGNSSLDGVNTAAEANIYLGSEGSNLALSLTGNSQIAGNVSIVNPLGYVELRGGHSGIGGETGQDAIDDHVNVAVSPIDFPVPDTAHFEQYITTVVDDSTDTSQDVVLDNIRIAAGTNPNFSGHVELRGVIFIETPNVVTFTGNVSVTGIIIGDGDMDDSSGTNQIKFVGNSDSWPVSDLPDEPQFAGIRDETGTFVLAPGFDVSFGGNFSEFTGAIAGGNISIFGNTGGTINGSIISYSDSADAVRIVGNNDLSFNRPVNYETPAGFIESKSLSYMTGSYSERLQ